MSRLTASEKIFLHLVDERRRLAPREASVSAFVTWLQQIGHAGEWDQYELVEHYETLCERTGVEAMPSKWLGEALERHGCRRWQAELVKDGKRWRPMKVEVRKD